MADQTKTTTLFSLAALKTWLKVQLPDVSFDQQIAICGDAASEELESETGRIFVKRSVALRLDGSGKCEMALPGARPLVSIDSFTINGSPVDSSQYVFDADTAIVTFTSGQFSAGLKNVVLSVTAGFDVQDGTGLPRDVYRAGLDLAKAIYDEYGAGAIAASSVSIGPSTMVIKAANWPPSVKRVIDAWSDGWAP
jgi:hypothetical protein